MVKIPSELEKTFDLQLRAVDFPEPKREYRFHKIRKFLFDFAWPIMKIAVEIEGGTYGFKNQKTGRFVRSGRHSRGIGFHNDCIKYNLAAIDGWIVIRGDSKMVKSGELLSHLEDMFESWKTGLS
jgi:very-short-patch-repair endonuclease